MARPCSSPWMLGLVAVCACSNGGKSPIDSGAPPSAITPLYVTVASHLEENFIGQCNQFEERQQFLVLWADMLESYGVQWNIQTMTNFTEKIVQCEEDPHREATGGKNLLQYLYEDRSIEFDAHAHESDNPATKNYTDVREEIHQLGEIPYDHLIAVGGFDSGDQEMLDEFIAGKPPRVYVDDPDAETWYPELLTFSAIPGHGAGEDFSAGMWNPAGLDHPLPSGDEGVEYYTHDADQPITLAGGGWTRACQHGWRGDGPAPYDFWEMSDANNAMVDALAAGEIPGGEMTSATFYIRQVHLTDPDTYIPQYEAQLQELQARVETGEIVYVHFQELIPIWEEDYDRRPNIIRTSALSSRATCEDGMPTLAEDEGEVPEDN